MNLNSKKTYRLYDVSEKLDEHGHYGLESFDDPAYNEVIDEDDIDATLCQLADVLFGQSGCRHFEITDDVMTTEAGKLCIAIDDDDSLEIQDIVNSINVAPEESWLYVLVNASRTEYRWVAALSNGTVYSD